MIIQLENPKTDSYNSLKSLVHGPYFQWFYNEYFIHQDSPSYNKLIDRGDDVSKYSETSFLSHDVLTRPLDNRKYSYPGSNYVEPFYNVLVEIFNHNNIELNCLYRMNANMVFPQEGKQQTIPHTDHKFPHNNLIIYLTSSGGQTVCEGEVFDPKEDDIITFTGEHYFMLPKKDKRIVLVATYI